MAQMKLILLQDVEDLGLAGEEVHVAAGFGRNFLIPRGLATAASTATLRQLAARKGKIEQKRKEDIEAAQALAAKIESSDIVISVQASEDNHLYGSVSERMIAETLLALGIKVDIQKIRLETAIRMTGEYAVAIKLHQGVVATAKVRVVRA